jgi:hypothetical protein
MSSRPLPVTVAAILLVLLALSDFPWLFDFLFSRGGRTTGVRGGRTTGVYPLLGICGGRCGPRRRGRIMDAESVELLGHHRSVCAQLPFRSTGGSPGARGRTESCYRSNGGSGYPHHSVGSASRLSAGFGRCRTTFARKVSRVSEKNPSRQFVNRGNGSSPVLEGIGNW